MRGSRRIRASTPCCPRSSRPWWTPRSRSSSTTSGSSRRSASTARTRSCCTSAPERPIRRRRARGSRRRSNACRTARARGSCSRTTSAGRSTRVLELAGPLGVPVVFDAFHHSLAPSFEGDDVRDVVLAARRDVARAATAVRRCTSRRRSPAKRQRRARRDDRSRRVRRVRERGRRPAARLRPRGEGQGAVRPARPRAAAHARVRRVGEKTSASSHGGRLAGERERRGRLARSRRVAAAVAVEAGGDDEALAQEPDHRQLVRSEAHRADPLGRRRPAVELGEVAVPVLEQQPVHGLGALARARVGERPVVPAAEDERRAAVAQPAARLVEVDRAVLGGDDAAARSGPRRPR